MRLLILRQMALPSRRRHKHGLQRYIIDLRVCFLHDPLDP